MSAFLFDTHEAVKELEAAGFTDEQAEALIRAVRKAQGVDLSNLVTKADLQATNADLRVGLAELRSEILKWMVSSMGLQTIVIIGAVVALLRMAR